MERAMQKTNKNDQKYAEFGMIRDHKLRIPPFEHKAPIDDDCGMPETPIANDYAKYLWTSHTKSGGVPSLIRSKKRITGRNECEKLP